MRPLTAVLHESWPVYREALPAGVTHAVEDDSIRTGELQATCEFLRRDVAVRVIDVGHAVAFPADVVKARHDVTEVRPHIELEWPLSGCAQEDLAVIASLGDRGVEARRRVEGAESIIGKATAFGVEMRERRHDDGSTGSEDAVLPWHELDLTYVVAQTGIR